MPTTHAVQESVAGMTSAIDQPAQGTLPPRIPPEADALIAELSPPRSAARPAHPPTQINWNVDQIPCGAPLPVERVRSYDEELTEIDKLFDELDPRAAAARDLARIQSDEGLGLVSARLDTMFGPDRGAVTCPLPIQIPLFPPDVRYHFTGHEPKRSERPPYSNLPLAAAVQSAILQRLAGGTGPQRAARQSDARSEALPAEREALADDVHDLAYQLFADTIDRAADDFYGGDDSALADDVRRSLAGLSPEYLDSLLPNYQYWSQEGRAYARLRTLAQQIAVGLTVVRAHPHLHQPQRRTTSHANDLRSAA